MKKTAVFIAGMLLAILALASPLQAQEKVIKVGALIAISGPIAFIGDPQAKALQMIVDQKNADGGLAGSRIELTTYDTEGNATKASQLARRLIDSDKVDVVIGPSTTGESLAVKPIAQEAKVPNINFAGGEVGGVPDQSVHLQDAALRPRRREAHARLHEQAGHQVDRGAELERCLWAIRIGHHPPGCAPVRHRGYDGRGVRFKGYRRDRPGAAGPGQQCRCHPELEQQPGTDHRSAQREGNRVRQADLQWLRSRDQAAGRSGRDRGRRGLSFLDATAGTGKASPPTIP